jgi:histidinol-phosphatase (PHP family)
MYLSNYHSHSTFCDGRCSMEELVHFAIAKGVKKFGFSSHAPLPFDTFWNMKADDLPEYKAEFHRLKRKYTGQIELYLGLEIDYIPECFDARQAFYPTDDLDYLIGSIHYIDALPCGGFMSIDGNFSVFQQGLDTMYGGDIWAVVKRYFEASRDMVEKGGFQIVGHVDKVAMNASRCIGFDSHNPRFVNLIGDLFSLIRSKGLIVEINTKSLMEKGITYPGQHYFPLLNELGIPVTVNSDCHYPTNVIDGIVIATKALKDAGFRSIYQLDEGSWQAVELD